MKKCRGKRGAKRRLQSVRLVGCLIALATLANVIAVPGASANFNPRKAIWGPALINGKSAFPTYKRLGVGIYSIAVDWGRVAPSRPVDPRDPNDPAYRWPKNIVGWITEARDNGIQVNIELTHAPAWANGGRERHWAPEDPQDFADFAVAAAKRFPWVHLWMVWGEPSRSQSFNPLYPAESRTIFLNRLQVQAPQRYAQIVDATYGALKDLDPQNLIIAGDTYTAGAIRAPLWVRYMRLPNGLPPRMDMYGHNPFGTRKPSFDNAPSSLKYHTVDFSDLERFHSLVIRQLAWPRGKVDMKIFISEWCQSTGPDTQFPFRVSLSTQADWINSAFGLLNSSRGRFIYSLGWINLQDTKSTSCGLLKTDGTEKPGFTAFMNG